MENALRSSRSELSVFKFVLVSQSLHLEPKQRGTTAFGTEIARSSLDAPEGVEVVEVVEVAEVAEVAEVVEVAAAAAVEMV